MSAELGLGSVFVRMEINADHFHDSISRAASSWKQSAPIKLAFDFSGLAAGLGSAISTLRPLPIKITADSAAFSASMKGVETASANAAMASTKQWAQSANESSKAQVASIKAVSAEQGRSVSAALRNNADMAASEKSLLAEAQKRLAALKNGSAEERQEAVATVAAHKLNIATIAEESRQMKSTAQAARDSAQAQVAGVNQAISALKSEEVEVNRLHALQSQRIESFKGMASGLASATSGSFKLVANGLSSAFSAVGSALTKINLTVLAVGVGAMAFADKAMKMAIESDKISRGTNALVGGGAEGLDKLTKKGIEISTDASVTVGGADVQKGMELMARSGKSLDVVLASAHGMAQLATATTSSMADLTNSYLDATSKFNLSTKDAEKSVGSFGGLLTSAKISASDAANFGKYYQAQKQGIDGLNDSLKLQALLAQTGLRGSSAATAVNADFAQIDKSKKSLGGKSFASILGVKTTEADGKTLRSQLDIILDTRVAYQKLIATEGDAAASATARAALGERGFKAMQALAGLTNEQVKKSIGAIDGGFEKLNAMSQAQLEAIGVGAITLKNSNEAMMRALGRSFAPVINTMQMGLAEMANSIATLPVLDQLKGMAKGLAAAFAAPSVQANLKTLQALFVGLAEGGIKLVIKGVENFIGFLKDKEAIDKFTGFISGLVTAFRFLAGVVGAVVGTEFKLLVGVVKAVSDGFTEAFKNPETKAGLERIGAMLKEMAEGGLKLVVKGVQVIMSLLPLAIPIVERVLKGFKDVGDEFKGAIGAQVVANSNTPKTGPGNSPAKLPNLNADIKLTAPDEFGQALNNVYVAFKPVAEALGDFIKQIGPPMLNILGSVLKGASAMMIPLGQVLAIGIRLVTVALDPVVKGLSLIVSIGASFLQFLGSAGGAMGQFANQLIRTAQSGLAGFNSANTRMLQSGTIAASKVSSMWASSMFSIQKAVGAVGAYFSSIANYIGKGWSLMLFSMQAKMALFGAAFTAAISTAQSYWGAALKYMSDAGDWIKGQIQGFISFAGGFFQAQIDRAKGLFYEATAYISDLASWVRDRIGAAIQSMIDKAIGAVDWVKQKIQDFADSIKTLITNALDALQGPIDKVKGAFSGIGDSIKSAGGILDGWGKTFTGLIKQITDFAGIAKGIFGGGTNGSGGGLLDQMMAKMGLLGGGSGGVSVGGLGATIAAASAMGAGAADQKANINSIVAAALQGGVADKNQIAYILATAFHESGFRPINEIGDNAYFTQSYEGRSDLGNTQAGDGAKYHGRGYVQLTGRNNYEQYSKILGVDLVNNPDLALDPAIAAKILIDGMKRGTFTGTSLGTYIGGGSADFYDARRIINGTDRAGDIAGYAVSFSNALQSMTGQITQVAGAGGGKVGSIGGVYSGGAEIGRYGVSAAAYLADHHDYQYDSQGRRVRDVTIQDTAGSVRAAIGALTTGIVTAVNKGAVEGDISAGGGFGNYVQIRDAATGIETMMAHMTDVAVSEGQMVQMGQYVGHEGNTGHSFGEHVHVAATDSIINRWVDWMASLEQGGGGGGNVGGIGGGLADQAMAAARALQMKRADIQGDTLEAASAHIAALKKQNALDIAKFDTMHGATVVTIANLTKSQEKDLELFKLKQKSALETSEHTLEIEKELLTKAKKETEIKRITASIADKQRRYDELLKIQELELEKFQEKQAKAVGTSKRVGGLSAKDAAARMAIVESQAVAIAKAEKALSEAMKAAGLNMATSIGVIQGLFSKSVTALRKANEDYRNGLLTNLDYERNVAENRGIGPAQFVKSLAYAVTHPFIQKFPTVQTTTGPALLTANTQQNAASIPVNAVTKPIVKEVAVKTAALPIVAAPVVVGGNANGGNSSAARTGGGVVKINIVTRLVQGPNGRSEEIASMKDLKTALSEIEAQLNLRLSYEGRLFIGLG